MRNENDTLLTNSRCQNSYSVIPSWGIINNDAGKTIVDEGTVENKNSNQAVSVLTAGIRAIAYQIQSLYLRSPVKLFRPSRFDYMAYVRALADRPVSYTHLTLPTNSVWCRSRWSPYH